MCIDEYGGQLEEQEVRGIELEEGGIGEEKGAQCHDGVDEEGVSIEVPIMDAHFQVPQKVSHRHGYHPTDALRVAPNPVPRQLISGRIHYGQDTI